MSRAMPSNMLAGRVAAVTGGASGLGLSTARCLASHGASVFLLDLDADQAREAAQTVGSAVEHHGIRCDVTQEEDRRTALEQVVHIAGRLDILVNNAGIQYHASAEAIEPDRWRQLMAVNLDAVMFLSQSAARYMIPQKSGSIINIASLNALFGMPGRVAYTTSKTALLGLTRNLAVDWGKYGIRVNAVCPGYHQTPMLEEYVRRGVLDPERIRRRIPFGRIGLPSDVGDAVVFFASDLSSYVTGQHLVVDGGYSVFGAPSEASA
ncbi:MAG: glucose 1-dehydrogenase [Pirellulales bacterium]|nr:glucose 1-dehydrogenase [Pirellulales bacterium]